MRPSLSVEPEDSLARAAGTMRENGTVLLPVVREGRLLGVVTEQSLGLALGEGTDLREPVTAAMVAAPTIPSYVSGAEALRRLTEERDPTLVVIDDEYRMLGLVSPTDLFPRRRPMPRPNAVGGMATPFGVYLTTGSVSGGPKKYALVATGMVLFALMFSGQVLGLLAQEWMIRQELPDSLVGFLGGFVSLAVFLLGMRLIPLAGVHAAEHQVVHAIERGEDLSPELVKRMPRVHPRCGTNLAAGALLFLGLFQSGWFPDSETALLVSGLATVLLWRRLGTFLQYFITTRPASDKQIRMGIRSGEQLLERHLASRAATASIPIRIWNSGMLHVITGSTLCYGLIVGIAALVGIDLGPLA
jgi:hypothetical protein